MRVVVPGQGFVRGVQHYCWRRGLYHMRLVVVVPDLGRGYLVLKPRVILSDVIDC